MSKRDEHKLALTDTEKDRCMQYEIFRTARTQYNEAVQERQLVQKYIKVPEFFEESARTRVMEAATLKESEAKARVVELARLILEEPEFKVGMCDVKWDGERWWCAFPVADDAAVEGSRGQCGSTPVPGSVTEGLEREW